MNQFKKAQVIMLPTENKINGSIVKDIKEESKILHIKQKDYCEHEDFVAQYLYITSDDEIREGDWSYNIVNKTIFQADSQFVKLINQKEVTTNKKIIATTDTSLNNCAVMYCSEKCIDYCVYKNDLPKPSQQFIEKYIESYNKGEVITDVLVELKSSDLHYFNEDLRINPKDNTITIKKLKDNLNREEVIYLMKNSFQKGIESQYNNWDENDFNLDNWIEENL